MPCWTDVWGGKGQRGKWRDLKKETDRLADGSEDRTGEERGVYLNDGADIWNQTSGIKISGMQLEKNNLVVTPCILLVGVKISQQFKVGNVEELFSRRSFVAVTWSTDVVSMRINKRIPPQHHYKDIPERPRHALLWHVRLSSCRPSAGNLEIMAGQRFCQWKKKKKGGHCCVNHSGQEEHVWSAHTWSQVTFSRGLIWGSHTVVVVSKTSAECRLVL